MTLALLSFVAGLLARHYGPRLWVAGKRWLGRTFFGVGIE